MKKRMILTTAFILSLSPMLLNQYGAKRGVQEISGLINLLNPIGIAAVVLFIIGVWLPINSAKVSKAIGGIGTIGIVLSEIYRFLTWHIMTITGEFSIQTSLRMAFPEFYIGLVVSLVMVIFYFSVDKLVNIT